MSAEHCIVCGANAELHHEMECPKLCECKRTRLRANEHYVFVRSGCYVIVSCRIRDCIGGYLCERLIRQHIYSLHSSDKHVCAACKTMGGWHPMYVCPNACPCGDFFMEDHNAEDHECFHCWHRGYEHASKDCPKHPRFQVQ